MCVVIDTCAIHSVFGVTTKNHDDFKPVLDWLVKKEGKMIYGGTKYKNELKKSIGKYSKLMRILHSTGKIICLNDKDIDDLEKSIIKIESDKDFDDPHLLAIVINSGCKVVCTNEKRAIKFLKKKELFPCSKLRPKIYSSKKNVALTTDSRYLSPLCIS